MEPVEIPITVDDQATKPIAGVEASLNSLEKSVQQMTEAFKTFGQAGQQVQQVGTQTVAVGTLIGNVYTAAASAVASAFSQVASAIPAATSAAAAFGNEMVALNVKTGETMDTLQKMRFAADQSGLGFESIIAASRKMQGAVAQGSKQAAEALAQIGAKAGTPIDEIIKKLSEIEDPLKRAAVSADLFGNKVGPQIARASLEFSKAAAEAKSLGLVLDEALIRASGEANDKMSALSQQLKAMTLTFGGAILQSGALHAALDLLKQGFAAVIHWIDENKQAITEFTNFAVIFLADVIASTLIPALSFAVDVFTTVRVAVANLATTFDLLAIAARAAADVLANPASAASIITKAMADSEKAIAKYNDEINKSAVQNSALQGKVEQFRVALDGAVATIVKGASANKTLAASNKDTASSYQQLGKEAEAAAKKALDAIEALAQGMQSKIAEASLQAGTDIEQALGKVRSETLSTLEKINSVAAKAPQDQRVQAAAEAAKQQAFALESVQRAAAITAERMKTLGQTNEDVAKSAANLAQTYNLWTAEAAGDVNALTADALDGLLAKMDELARKAPEVAAVFAKMRGDVAAALTAKNVQGIFSEQQTNKEIARIQTMQSIEQEIATARTQSIEAQIAASAELAQISGRQLSIEQQTANALAGIEQQRESAVAAADLQFRAETEILEKKLRQKPEDEAAIALQKEKLAIHHDTVVVMAEENAEREKAIALAREQAMETQKILGAVESVGTAIAGFFGPEVAAGFKAADQAAQQLVGSLRQIQSGDIAGGIGNLVQGVMAAAAAFKQATDSASDFSRAVGGALVGAKLGSQIGSLFGPTGALVGGAIGAIAGGIAGLFKKPAWAQAGEAAGKVFGFGVSKELAKAIEATAKELEIDFEAASLLHITDAIEESGKSAREFGASISNLMGGITTGAIPATEGIEALDAAFQAVTEDAAKAGVVGDRTTRQIIAQAKAMGTVTEGMEAFMQEQSDLAKTGGAAFASAFAAGLTATGDDATEEAAKAFAGIAATTEEQGRAAAANFIAAFNVTMEQEGLVGAADAFRDSFKEIHDAIAEQFGPDFAKEVLGPIGGLFSLTEEGSPFRGAAELGDSLNQIMTAVANSGQLTADSFKNLGISAQQAFAQGVAAGATQEQALSAILPFLQSAVSASEQYGIALDENTAGLVAMAEESGFAFPTDPLLQVVDLLGVIATQLGATLPASFQATGAAAAGMAQQTGSAVAQVAQQTSAAAAQAAQTTGAASAAASQAAAGAARAAQTAAQQTTSATAAAAQAATTSAQAAATAAQQSAAATATAAKAAVGAAEAAASAVASQTTTATKEMAQAAVEAAGVIDATLPESFKRAGAAATAMAQEAQAAAAAVAQQAAAAVPAAPVAAAAPESFKQAAIAAAATAQAAVDAAQTIGAVLPDSFAKTTDAANAMAQESAAAFASMAQAAATAAQPVAAPELPVPESFARTAEAAELMSKRTTDAVRTMAREITVSTEQAAAGAAAAVGAPSVPEGFAETTAAARLMAQEVTRTMATVAQEATKGASEAALGAAQVIGTLPASFSGISEAATTMSKETTAAITALVTETTAATSTASQAAMTQAQAAAAAVRTVSGAAVEATGQAASEVEVIAARLGATLPANFQQAADAAVAMASQTTDAVTTMAQQTTAATQTAAQAAAGAATASSAAAQTAALASITAAGKVEEFASRIQTTLPESFRGAGEAATTMAEQTGDAVEAMAARTTIAADVAAQAAAAAATTAATTTQAAAQAALNELLNTQNKAKQMGEALPASFAQAVAEAEAQVASFGEQIGLLPEAFQELPSAASAALTATADTIGLLPTGFGQVSLSAEEMAQAMAVNMQQAAGVAVAAIESIGTAADLETIGTLPEGFEQAALSAEGLARAMELNIAQAAGVAVDAVQSISTATSAATVGALPEGFQQLAQAAEQAAESMGDNMEQAAGRAVEAVQSIGTAADLDVVGTLPEGFQAATLAAEQMAQAMGQTIEQAAGVAVQAVEGIGTAVGQVSVGTMSDSFQQAASEISVVAGDIANQFSTTIPEGFQALSLAADEMAQDTTAAVSSVSAQTTATVEAASQAAIALTQAASTGSQEAMQAAAAEVLNIENIARSLGITLPASFQAAADAARAMLAGTGDAMTAVALETAAATQTATAGVTAITTTLSTTLPQSFQAATAAAVGFASHTTDAVQSLAADATIATQTTSQAAISAAQATTTANQTAAASAVASSNQIQKALDGVADKGLLGIQTAFEGIADATVVAVDDAADAFPALDDASADAGTSVASNVEVAIAQLVALEEKALAAARAINTIGQTGNINIPGATGAPVPPMQEGGFVPATPGGQLRLLGEGGEGEFVVPESKMNQNVTLNLNISGSNLTQEQLTRAAVDAIRNAEGDLLRLTGARRG